VAASPEGHVGLLPAPAALLHEPGRFECRTPRKVPRSAAPTSTAAAPALPSSPY
jgi:hypothetical protein